LIFHGLHAFPSILDKLKDEKLRFLVKNLVVRSIDMTTIKEKKLNMDLSAVKKSFSTPGYFNFIGHTKLIRSFFYKTSPK
jgi:hypothetical protein